MAKLRDYVLLADDIYNPSRDSSPPKGWKAVHGLAVDEKDGARGVSTSLQCRAYRNEATHEAIIAYRGTNSLGDVPADISIALYRQGQHMTEAIKVTMEWIFKVNVERKRLTLTGHSLGGAVAQIVGYHLGLRFVTFSAPGMLANTPGLSSFVANPWSSDNLRRGMNYIAWGDPIGNYGRHIGDTTRVHVAGVKHAIRTTNGGGAGPASLVGGSSWSPLMDHGIANFIQLLMAGNVKFQPEKEPLS